MRALWGEPEGSVCPTKGYASAVAHIERASEAPYQPVPSVTYSWGLDNHGMLDILGLDPVLADAAPIVNYSTDGRPRDSCSRHHVNWGVSHWRQKLYSIQMTLRSHEVAIWLDWDVWQMKELPDDFWDRLGAGQPYQASLRKYVRRQCPWRKRDQVGRCRVPHGAWTYCRSKDLITQAIDTHEKYVPTLTDEVAWAKLIDIRHNGWIGDDEWKRLGYEPFCYDQQGDSRVIHPCEEPLFKNVGKSQSPEKNHGG